MISQFLIALGFGATVAGVVMTLAFVYSLYRRRADVADIAWGLCAMVIAIASFAHWNVVPSIRQLIVIVLVCIWGMRLARHIHARQSGKPEDYRYVAWRKDWGRWFTVRSYGQIFLLQGFLMTLICAPVIFVHRFDESIFTLFGWGLYETLGVAIWYVGYYFESRADRELKEFLGKPENKGKILTTGLWAYSRHPNYFGEVTQWWGVWCIALGLPLGWMSVIGPLTITFLILKVSGIPMLEKKYEGNLEFEAYKHRTSAFFPLPPKS